MGVDADLAKHGHLLQHDFLPKEAHGLVSSINIRHGITSQRGMVHERHITPGARHRQTAIDSDDLTGHRRRVDHKTNGTGNILRIAAPTQRIATMITGELGRRLIATDQSQARRHASDTQIRRES